MIGTISHQPAPSGVQVTDAHTTSSRRAATIYDVAQLAGVSPSTVSRALSRPDRISAATAARIRVAAEQLNFRINRMARALHTGRTGTLALVVADITNPVVFGIVRGAEQAASARDYTLMIAESQESGETEDAAIERILPGVDGIILATTRLSSRRIRDLASHKPVVLINRAVEGIPAVLPDVELGVSQVLEHLTALDHRAIAFISGPAESWIGERRWAYLMKGAESAGMTLVEIRPDAPTIEGGRSSLRRVLAAGPTVVVAFNDLLAIGLIQAATAAGIRIPAELSVVGFDDIFGSDLITPSLTTVRAPLEEAGRRATEHLLARLEGHPPTQFEERLGTTLVLRESTAPAPSPR